MVVRESVAPALTGHEARSYASPPQPREQALELVALLLGHATEPVDGKASWSAPIPGGKRIVTLSNAPPP